MLVRLRNADDELSWEDFYRRYRPLVLGFSLKLSLTREEAEEVCQDVFAEIAQKISQFDTNRERGSFRSWLFQRTEWRVRDKYRKRLRSLPQAPILEEVNCVDDVAIPIPIRAELEELWDSEWAKFKIEIGLQRLSRKVSARNFQAFELHAIREWSVLRVAESLGMNPATVCVNTHRLRKLLRQELERQDV